MNIYGNNLISSRNTKLLNIMLITMGVFFLGWTLSIWMAPSTVSSSGVKLKKEMTGKYERLRLLRMSAYNTIAANDLFRATRKRYVAPPKATAVKKVVRTAAPLKTPNLRLFGTIILDDGRAAVMSIQGLESATKSYKVGETIGGFKINKITDNTVSLKRGTETLTVLMNEKAGSYGTDGARMAPGAAPALTRGSSGSQKKPRKMSPRWFSR